MSNITLPATGSGTSTPIVNTDVVSADGSNVQNVQDVQVAAGVLSRINDANPKPSKLVGGSLAAGAQVTSTTTAGTLIGSNATRKGLLIRSLSSNLVSAFIGPATVTATTGFEIKPGESLLFSAGEGPVNLIQSITASSTAVLIVQEIA